MERKDLKPVEEMLLNLYNDNHEHKIKLEKVKEFWVEDGKLCIVCEDYDEEGMFFGYVDYTMDITLNNEDMVNYNRTQYNRAIELAAQAIYYNTTPFMNRFISGQDIQNLKYIYENYWKLVDRYIEDAVNTASNDSIIIDTGEEKISYFGDYVVFYDIEGHEHKIKFDWFLSPDLTELSDYFANYKKAERREKIYKCKDDIERYKKWILESEEELKKLEEEE